jgi:hypothetical protein
VTATPLTHHRASGCPQQLAQRAVELRRHSTCGRLGFAQRRDLQK